MFLKINRSVKTPLHRPSMELLALGYKLLTIWKICKYLSVQRCRINSTLISYGFLVVKQIKDSLIFMAVVTFSSTVKTVEWVEPTVQRGVRPTKEAKVPFANNVRRISWNEKIIYKSNWSAWDQKTAEISRRHRWFPREMTSNRNSILMTCHYLYPIWVVLLIGWSQFLSRYNQSEVLPRSGFWDVISMEFLRSFLTRHFAGNLVGGVANFIGRFFFRLTVG